MRRALRIVWLSLGVLLTGTALGVLAFALWLLLSTSGARWLLAEVQRNSPVPIEVQGIEGRLITPLSLHGVHVAAPGMDVQLDRVSIRIAPLALLRGALRIDAIEAGRLVLQQTPHETAPATTAPRLSPPPLDLELRRFSLAHLEWHGAQPAQVQQVEDIELDHLRWAGESLQLTRLGARHALSGRVEAFAELRLAPEVVHIDRLQLHTLNPTSTRIEAKGALPLDAQTLQLDLDWQNLRWPLTGDAQIDSAQGHLSLQGSAQDLHAQLRGALGEHAQVQAEVRYHQQRLSAQASWTALQWPLRGTARVVSADGRLTLDGVPADYRYQLDAQLAAEGQNGRAQASGSGGLQQLRLDTLRLAVAQSVAEGRAQVDWSAAPVIDADLRLRDVDPGLLAADWRGRLNGALKARTAIHNGHTQVDFTLALKSSQLRGYPLQLDAQGQARDTTVTLDRFALRSATTRLDASGQVTPPFDVRARLDSPDLGALWPGLHGRAQLDARLLGALEAPRLLARGEVKALQYQTLSAAHLALDADVALDGAWTLALDARDLDGPAQVHRATLGVDGAAQDHRLRLSVEADQGQIDLQAQGGLDRASRQWRGQLLSGRLQPKDLAAWTLQEPADFSVTTAQQQLQPACWQAPDSRACLQLTHSAERLRAAFRLEQLDFAYFAPFLAPGWSLTGGVDGTGVVELREGRLAEARADLSTDPIEVLRDGERLLSAQRGSLRVQEVAAGTLAQLRLPLQGGQVRLDAQLDARTGASAFDQRPLSAQLQVALTDLGFLRLASPELEQVGGRIEGQMTWTGTLAQPQPAGELRLVDAHLHLATPGIDITALNAKIGSRSGASALQLSGSAQSGGGSLSFQGTVNPVDTSAGTQIQIRGSDFQAANMTEARAWISPRLDVSLKGRKLDVSGEVDVPRAEITPVSFDSGVGPSADQVIIVDKADLERREALQVSADVRLNLGKRVRFEGFGLKTELQGSVRAIEQPGRPGSGRGEVRLVNGRYKAYGQDLEISSGRLLFNGGPLSEPAVDIRALRKPTEDIEVGVFVRGTLDHPEFQLFSTPAMPRERQLSWLVLGRSLEEGGAADERAMLANAALTLGLTGTDFLAQNLRGGLKLDEVSIGAQPGEQAQAARFTVGKYLSSKLYVSYGIGLFQPGQVFKLLYELGHGFKFSTESGVHTGGDLLYSVERK